MSPRRTAGPKVTEKSLQAQVLELARLTGWRVYFTWRSYHSPKGFPDLVLVRPPRLMFAELKAADGTVSDDQEGWHEDLRAIQGAEMYVWRPKDWEEIVACLSR